MSSYYDKRPVLVTGGCGFIGSHLVEALLERGAHVRVLGRYSSSGSWGHLEHLREVEPRLDVRLGSISDGAFVSDCVSGCDVVFHLAALIGIPYSYVAPMHNVETNVMGTLHVLEAMRRHHPSRLVHTSTSETFGSAQYVPMDEKHPIVAQSPYAATKVAADQLVGSYWRSFGTPGVTVRPFNTFGPRQSRRAVIPAIITQALQGRTVQLGSTTPVRDMNPVANTVQGMLLAGSVPDIEGELIVLGSGEGRTIAEIVSAIEELLEVSIVVETDPARVRPAGSEVDRLVCDCRHASAILGYEPTESFRTGLKKTIDWLRSLGAQSTRYAI